MKHSLYRKLLSIILSLSLVITSMPPVGAEEFLAVPGNKELISLDFTNKPIGRNIIPGRRSMYDDEIKSLKDPLLSLKERTDAAISLVPHVKEYEVREALMRFIKDLRKPWQLHRMVKRLIQCKDNPSGVCLLREAIENKNIRDRKKAVSHLKRFIKKSVIFFFIYFMFIGITAASIALNIHWIAITSLIVCIVGYGLFLSVIVEILLKIILPDTKTLTLDAIKSPLGDDVRAPFESGIENKKTITDKVVFLYSYTYFNEVTPLIFNRVKNLLEKKAETEEDITAILDFLLFLIKKKDRNQKILDYLKNKADEIMDKSVNMGDAFASISLKERLIIKALSRTDGQEKLVRLVMKPTIPLEMREEYLNKLAGYKLDQGLEAICKRSDKKRFFNLLTEIYETYHVTPHAVLVDALIKEKVSLKELESLKPRLKNKKPDEIFDIFQFGGKDGENIFLASLLYTVGYSDNLYMFYGILKALLMKLDNIDDFREWYEVCSSRFYSRSLSTIHLPLYESNLIPHLIYTAPDLETMKAYFEIIHEYKNTDDKNKPFDGIAIIELIDKLKDINSLLMPAFYVPVTIREITYDPVQNKNVKVFNEAAFKNELEANHIIKRTINGNVKYYFPWKNPLRLFDETHFRTLLHKFGHFCAVYKGNGGSRRTMISGLAVNLRKGKTPHVLHGGLPEPEARIWLDILFRKIFTKLEEKNDPVLHLAKQYGADINMFRYPVAVAKPDVVPGVVTGDLSRKARRLLKHSVQPDTSIPIPEDVKYIPIRKYLDFIGISTYWDPVMYVYYTLSNVRMQEFNNSKVIEPFFDYFGYEVEYNKIDGSICRVKEKGSGQYIPRDIAANTILISAASRYALFLHIVQKYFKGCVHNKYGSVFSSHNYNPITLFDYDTIRFNLSLLKRKFAFRKDIKDAKDAILQLAGFLGISASEGIRVFDEIFKQAENIQIESLADLLGEDSESRLKLDMDLNDMVVQQAH